jgi:hypothetical protein
MIASLTSSTAITYIATFMCLDDDPAVEPLIPNVEYEPGEVIVDVLATARSKRLLQREYHETMGYDPDKPFAGKRTSGRGGAFVVNRA